MGLLVLTKGQKVKSKRILKWIVFAILVTLGAAGGLMAWAAPSDGDDDAAEVAPEPAGAHLGGVVTTVSAPASTPRAFPRIVIDAELIGTAIVEGGPSLAVFQLTGGTRLVREGDEIAKGVRLVEVRRNRIEVERDGIHQEIRLGSSEGIRQGVHTDSIRGAPTEVDTGGVRDFRRDKARLLQEWLAGHRG
jgi:hypothetical protein